MSTGKAHAEEPLRHAAVWHSHNAAAVSRWLDAQELRWRGAAPGGAAPTGGERGGGGGVEVVEGCAAAPARVAGRPGNRA